jgi:hypothetical protein
MISPYRLLSQASYMASVFSGVVGLGSLSSPGLGEPSLIVASAAFIALGLDLWFRWREGVVQRNPSEFAGNFVGIGD